jgi:soluble lytic murein transglycosylase
MDRTIPRPYPSLFLPNGCRSFQEIHSLKGALLRERSARIWMKSSMRNTRLQAGWEISQEVQNGKVKKGLGCSLLPSDQPIDTICYLLYDVGRMYRSVRSIGLFILFTMLTVMACRVPIIGPLFATPTATSTPTATMTPTPTPTPTLTPTPTPLPETRYELGEKARMYGDWDNALAEYQLALQITQDSDEQDASELGIGLTLVEAKRYGEAQQYLTDLLERYPEGDLRARAYFLRGRALLGMGENEQAVEDFSQYPSQKPGVLDSYTHELIGDLLRGLGRQAEGIEHYQLAMTAPRLGGTLSLQIKWGHALFEGGEYAQAFEKFDEVYNLTSDPETKAAMNLMAGRSLEMIGDFENAYSKYLDSVFSFPEQDASYLGLITLVNAGVSVDEFQRGLVDYYAEAYEPALAAFNRFIADTPTGAAFFYRGLTRSQLGDPWGALQDFQIVIDSYPQDAIWTQVWFEKADVEWLQLSDPKTAVETYLDFVAETPDNSLAPEALFEAARISERADALEDAAAIWIRISQEYPTSDQAYEGTFLAGITRFRLGLYHEARDAFLLADAIANDEGEKAAARLWVGKTYFAEGDRDAAEEAWVMAAVSDPTGYYSERAADLLKGLEPFHTVDSFHIPTNVDSEREQAESWMHERFVIQGSEPLNELDPTLASDDRMKRGMEFWRLGLYEEARAEFESLRASYGNDPEATYRLMHTFLDLGLYRSAIFAARNILQLAGMDDAATMEAPVYFNYIRFGFYFSDIILPETERYDFDPLFLFSVVRQESLFEGFVTSYANARGLMQVIPSTGQDIANKLGWPLSYSVDDLYRPLVSVRFGTDYLAEQRERFEGDLFAALSAYNAGPGNAYIWKALAPDDPDLYLELVRLDQPQRYIRTIYEIYDIYCNLYANP